MSAPLSADRPLAGIAAMLVAVLLFAVMDALIKAASADYSTVQIVFFRSAVAFVPILAYLLKTGGLRQLRTRRLGGHAYRAVIGLVAMASFFYAFAVMPLADVVAIGFAAPIMMTALAIPLLGERVGWRRWSAIVVGFAGVVLMVRPTGEIALGTWLALLGTICYALAMISIRQLSRTESAGAIVFYFGVFGVAAAGLLLPFFWQMPDARGWAILIAIGLLGGIAQIFMTRAFSIAPVSIVSPFDYTAILWATLLGWWFWREFPDWTTFVGAAIVVASGLYILRREAALAVQRARKPETSPPI